MLLAFVLIYGLFLGSPVFAYDNTGDFALILSTDVSESIDEKEHELQRVAILKSLTDETLIRRISDECSNGIWIRAIEWSSHVISKTEWTKIRPKTARRDLYAFALKAASPRKTTGLTGLGRSMVAVDKYLRQVSDVPRKAVILTSDGINNLTVFGRESRTPKVSMRNEHQVMVNFVRDHFQDVPIHSLVLPEKVVGWQGDSMLNYFATSISFLPGSTVRKFARWQDYHQTLLEALLNALRCEAFVS